MSDQPKSVADLQRIADEAAAFSQGFDQILQSIAFMEKFAAESGHDKRLPMGCIAFFASLHIRLKLGFKSSNPPDPSFTKERYMSECSNIYDALDGYLKSVQKEHQNENDR